MHWRDASATQTHYASDSSGSRTAASTISRQLVCSDGNSGSEKGLSAAGRSPKLMPSARAACTAAPLGSTRESRETASQIGTLLKLGGWKQIISPKRR